MPTSTLMYILRRLLVRTLLTVSLLALVLWAIPHFVPVDAYRPSVLARLNQHSIAQIGAQSFSLVLVPYVGIRVHGLSLSVPGEKVPVAVADEGEVRLSLTSALEKTRRVTLWVPRASIRIDQLENLDRLWAPSKPSAPPPKRTAPPQLSRLEREIELRSKAIASGAFRPENPRPLRNTSTPAPTLPPVRMERHSVFEDITLTEIRIQEALVAPYTVNRVEIRPQPEGWRLTGEADRGLFPWFSCADPSSAQGRLEITISRAGITCSNPAQIR